jgi:hypothetical protein
VFIVFNGETSKKVEKTQEGKDEVKPWQLQAKSYKR